MTIMRSTLAMIIAVCAAVPLAWARDPVLEVFKAQAEIERRLLGGDLTRFERTQEQLREATDRMLRLGEDLVRAERDSEDVGALAARSVDARRAEREVIDLVAEAGTLRNGISSRRAHLEQLQNEIKRLEEAMKSAPDELSGRWTVAIEPGGMKGTFDLRLDGTIVAGDYLLSGGWKGSLRGTLVDGVIRLERIDAQQGFAAIYTGRLQNRSGERRIEGVWEATNLAAGMPAQGGWVARRESDS